MINFNKIAPYISIFIVFWFNNAVAMLSPEEVKEKDDNTRPIKAFADSSPAPQIPQDNIPSPPNPAPPRDNGDEDSEDDENYSCEPPQAQQKLALPFAFEEGLKNINSQLAAGKLANFSGFSRFFIPFYRGVHYLPGLFHSPKDRKDHRQNAKAGVPLVCSAAYTLLGKNFLSSDIDNSLLEKKAKLIENVLGKFKKNYPEQYYNFHEIYSNNHKKFHKNLKEVLPTTEPKPHDPLYPFYIYKTLFEQEIGLRTPAKRDAFQRNPFVSCSMTIEHALKYGSGLKKFNDGNSLNPKYIEQSRDKYSPNHPYLGMLYVILIDPCNLLNINPTSVVGGHQQRRLEIKTNGANILSEYEVSFFGWIPPQYVFLTTPVRVPNFKHGLKEYHKEKYGWPTTGSLGKKLVVYPSPMKNRWHEGKK